ncbi:uncharacterized protein LOC134764150 [Penaeus indicus]|uniref:uncharacterized protein LOC134764150 n=1 Tax=Penaeus indicus TaxID=29960 RepID=UPI00300C930F
MAAQPPQGISGHGQHRHTARPSFQVKGLRLQQAVRPARIYASAPSGVDVSVVRAVESSPALTPAGTSSAHASTPAESSPARLPSAFGHYSPRYYLYKSNVTDHRYFAINEFGGNITTARFIDRAVDKEYRLIVVVLVGGRAANQELSISVTQYNQYAPRLALDQYSAEVVVTADIGTPLLTVEAADDDEVAYNREIYYFLTSPEAGTEVDPFLEPPSWSPVGVDRDTGELRVTRALSLEASPLRLVVGAADGGSPQRYALANITIYIRNMSEPLHVSVNNSTESSLEVCWSPPAHGRPQGYVLTYTPTTAHKTYEKGSLNLTLEELHSTLVVPGAANTTSQGAAKGAGDALEIYRYCAVVGGLAGWTEYIVSVRAWAEGQVSMAASPLMATTRSDYCAVGVCGEGTCTLQEAPPGYACECHPGYYGPQCQHHNPCEPVNPCQHIGKCLNHSDGSYACDCLHGFYGQNCSRIDPCAAVSSNPCHNGGSCVRVIEPAHFELLIIVFELFKLSSATASQSTISRAGGTLTIFPATDDSVLAQAKDIAMEAKHSGQFTDTNAFRLECKQCGTLITGEDQALAHAKKTGHSKFDEVRNN